jgi:hypothetical protein
MSISTQQFIHRPNLTAVLPEHVHKTEAAEVLLTGWRSTGRDAFTVAARWPREHAFYTATRGMPDPLLTAETIRQAIPLLSHCAYDAPLDHRQSWSDLSYVLNSEALAVVADTSGDIEVELRITCFNVVRRGERLVALTMQVDVTADGVELGVARTTFHNHPPGVYRRLRGDHADLQQAILGALPLVPPVAAVLVGRECFHDVVLSPTDVANRTRLRVDLGHTVLFDHPVDHAPGMLMLEAARQASLSMAQPRAMLLTGIDCAFTRYAELDAPCWIQTDALPGDTAGHTRVLVSAVQNEAYIFSAVATLELLPEQ